MPAIIDSSGTITTGGASQQLAPARAERSWLLVQNISAGDLWVNFGIAAVANQPSIKITPGNNLEMIQFFRGFCPVDVLYIYGATTGQAFVCKEGLV